VDLNRFMREFTRVRTLADRLHQRLQAEAAPESSPLAETVAEFGTALEGLRVAEEELRVQTDTLVAAQEQLAAQRECYRELFESAPAPYLITDPAGTVRAANLRAVRLLGIPHEVLIGRPLVMFVVAEDRQRFPEWLGQLGSSTAAPEWTLRPQPRRRQPVPVMLAVHVARDEQDRVRELRCLLRPLPQRPASTPKNGARPLTPSQRPTGPRRRRQHDDVGWEAGIRERRAGDGCRAEAAGSHGSSLPAQGAPNRCNSAHDGALDGRGL
jgi:PAS domain S-box-containing protein